MVDARRCMPSSVDQTTSRTDLVAAHQSGDGILVVSSVGVSALTPITRIYRCDAKNIDYSSKTQLVLLLYSFIHYGDTASAFDQLLYIVQSRRFPPADGARLSFDNHQLIIEEEE